MKLALVVSHPIQHFCPWYANLAKNKGLEFKVFFASKLGAESYIDKNFEQKIKWNNLYLDEFEHEFLNDGKVTPSTAKLDAVELGDRLDEFDPDAIIIYGYWQLLSRRAYRWAVKNGKRIFYISDSEMRRKENPIISAMKKIRLQPYFRRIDYFLTVGDANASYYRSYGIGDHRLVYSPFPIDVNHFSNRRKESTVIGKALRERFGIAEDDLVLLMVGKHVSWKRPIDIIKALHRLEYLSQRFVLFLLGSGPDTKKLKEESKGLKKNRVILPGFVSPESLPDYYAASDIYIHPAEMEPHSLAISEAIYMGCPVILSNRCGSYGISDDVQLGVNGLSYECKNIVALSEQIIKLSSDKEMLASFAKKSSEIGAQKQHQAHFGGIKTVLNLIK